MPKLDKLTDYELAVQKHKYVTEPGGKPNVNITTIAKILDLDGKSMAFAFRAAQLQGEGLNFREVWNESAELGTRVHGYMEAYLLGRTIEARTSELGYVNALERFLTEKKPKLVIDPEFVVVSNFGYGGRGDMLVNIEGSPWLIDLKTGKHYVVEHTLQLAALKYAKLAQYEGGMLIGTEPMPTVNQTADLYVHEDGTYDLVEYPADIYTFHHFVDLLSVYKWVHSDPMKTLIKESKEKK